MAEPEPRSYSILWNASSGWDPADEAASKVEEILASQGSSVHLMRVQRGMDLGRESHKIARDHPSVLVAAGGDGTINAAAGALVHQPTALGVIPAGTLNHFARDLHIPIDYEGAAHVMLTGVETEVDAASVNGHVFLNNAVLGLFPNYRKERETWERRGLGRYRFGRWLAFAAAVLKVFWRLPHLTVRLRTDGGVHTLRTAFLLVANNEHRMEGLALGERSRLDEGRLWVYALKPCSRWKLLGMAVGLLIGRIRRSEAFVTFQTSHLTVESRRKRLGVGVDGELVRMGTPLEFRSLPKALKVIAPARS